jgi:hypothetical protein
MPLRNFIPALLAYLKSASALHIMGKLCNANDGLNTSFPSCPIFEPEMWRMAQRLDSSTLSLSLAHIECNYINSVPGRRSPMRSQLSERLRHPFQRRLGCGTAWAAPQMSISAIIVPSTQLIKSMERRNYILLKDIEEAIMPLHLQYQQLTNKDLDDYYEGNTAAMGPGHMLDVMESFHRLIHKFGQQHFKCCCTKGFRNMAGHRSALFSALWGPEVHVPAGLSEVMIPNRKGKVFSTAFDVDKVMEELEDTGPPP